MSDGGLEACSVHSGEAALSSLRAVLDEVCEDVSRYETGARTHVTSKILEAEGRNFARQAEAGRPRGSPRCANDLAIGGGERGVNFQVTMLKILVSYPDGFALMADLKRDMAILATSGPDWAERTKRLAALVADLDIFSQGLVERMNGGWRITEKGRGLLEVMEARPGEPDPASDYP
ncbi:hypothetical protein ACVWZ3_004919 [Bradyrhizobium sp. i1.3.6]